MKEIKKQWILNYRKKVKYADLDTTVIGIRKDIHGGFMENFKYSINKSFEYMEHIIQEVLIGTKYEEEERNILFYWYMIALDFRLCRKS